MSSVGWSLATLLITFLSIIDGVWTKSGGSEFTVEEQKALKECRPLVEQMLKKDYEKLDIYLIHWLRARELNSQAAKKMLEQSFAWRRETKVDTIVSDKKWEEYSQQYPATFGEAVDKTGRPAFQANFGKWDIRRGFLTGHNFERYLAYIFERITSIAFKKEQSEFAFLINMSGFNIRQHGCVACITFYVDLLTIYERNYPNMAGIIYLINTPRTFEGILKIITRLFSPHTTKTVKIFGLDKSEWQPVLLKHFDQDQLTLNFGGTKPGIV